MEVRIARSSELKLIKNLIDNFEEMDVIEETFPE